MDHMPPLCTPSLFKNVQYLYHPGIDPRKLDQLSLICEIVGSDRVLYQALLITPPPPLACFLTLSL